MRLVAASPRTSQDIDNRRFQLAQIEVEVGA